MVSYYTTLILLILLLQTKKITVFRTLITLVLVSTNGIIMDSYLDQGYSVYESAVRCEIIYLIFLVFTVNLHKSIVLFALTLVSLLVNTIYLVTNSMDIKLFIYHNYKLFNLILFECFLYYSVNTTRVYLALKKYLNTIKDKSEIYKKVVECFILSARLYQFIKSKIKREKLC